MDLEPLRQFIIAMGLSVVRITACFQVVPFLSGEIMPGLVRNSVMFSLALFLLPMTYDHAPNFFNDPLFALGLIFKEVVIGILIGYGAAIVFWAAQSIGFVIDNQRGASMASVFDPMSGSETSPLGQLLEQTMVTLFMVGGGFLLLLGGLFESYLVWPIDSFTPTFQDAFPGLFLEMTDKLMRLIVVLAAPVIITVFLTEFGLGLMNRFAPQLNVFFLAMPVKSAVGLFVLILYLPFLAGLLQKEFGGGKAVYEFLKGVIA